MQARTGALLSMISVPGVGRVLGRYLTPTPLDPRLFQLGHRGERPRKRTLRSSVVLAVLGLIMQERFVVLTAVEDAEDGNLVVPHVEADHDALLVAGDAAAPM